MAIISLDKLAPVWVRLLGCIAALGVALCILAFVIPDGYRNRILVAGLAMVVSTIWLCLIVGTVNVLGELVLCCCCTPSSPLPSNISHQHHYGAIEAQSQKQ